MNSTGSFHQASGVRPLYKPGALATGFPTRRWRSGLVRLVRSFRAGVITFARPVFLLLCFAFAVSAQGAAPPRIENVRIGLRGGQDVGRSRNGVWTPVQVTLKAGSDDVASGSFRLVVETADGEAVPCRYTAAVPSIPANSEQFVFAYVRPGSAASTFTVKLQKIDGQDVQTMDRLQRDPSEPKNEVLEPRDLLYLTVGSRLPGLKRALLEPDRPPGAPEPAQPTEEPEDRGNQRFAFVENVAGLPDRWFGYEAVDILVLTTASDAFVNQLLEMSKPRRDALLDWVRRGGKLVLSAGRNQQSVARWLDKMPLMECTLRGKVRRSSLPSVTLWSGRNAQEKQPLRQIEIACIRPGLNTYILVREERTPDDLEERPVLLQASYGLGRVILVAFDLDAPPFSTWEGQSAFWKKLHSAIAPQVSTAGADRPVGSFGQRSELGAELKQDLESFKEVPVISFGWVALFILFYIVLVGPLDYLILKKVFKRLELTWITFPIVVLVVSVAAYAMASYFKGNDLRINKIDLVEIDLHGPGQVYGTSWFTLFSPRIQNYTVGLELVAPGWGGRWHEEDADAPTPPMVVAPLDGPEPSLGGNSQGLFRRPYEYAEDVGGLVRVPIPVWATRTFTASWRAPLKDRKATDRPPLIKAELRISRDGNALNGAIVNNLPAELQGTVLFFHGKWYLLGDLVPGESREIGPLFERGVKKNNLGDWFHDTVLLPRPSSMPSRQQRDWHPTSSYLRLRSLLFHDAGSGELPNSGLRFLDESWRLSALQELPSPPHARFRKEVILVARTPPCTDKAETIAQDGVSPTRLWINQLPGTQSQRPALSGYLQQETYVRIYIPL